MLPLQFVIPSREMTFAGTADAIPFCCNGQTRRTLAISSGRPEANSRRLRLLTDRTIFPDHRTYAHTSRILSLERTKRYSFCHTVSYIQQYSNTSPRLCQASVMSKWDLDAAIIIAAAAIRADDGNCGGNGGNTGEDSDNDSNFFIRRTSFPFIYGCSQYGSMAAEYTVHPQPFYHLIYHPNVKNVGWGWKFSVNRRGWGTNLATE